MAEAGKVPVQESVGAALRFLRENLRLSAMLAAAGALTATLVAFLSLQVPALSLLLTIVSVFVSALIHAAFIGAALSGAGLQGQRLVADGGRVWAAMLVVAFFLCIVFVVLAIPGVIVLGAILAPQYGAEIQAASGDSAATMALAERMMTGSPGVFAGFALFYGLIWLALTSRLYLAAPASVDGRRILTFETWPWTKGNMLRIIGARLMLLAPAYILTFALNYILGMSLGVNVFSPDSVINFARENAPMFLVFSFVTSAFQIFLYDALEAGLSTYLYRGLKPATAAPAA